MPVRISASRDTNSPSPDEVPYRNYLIWTVTAVNAIPGGARKSTGATARGRNDRRAHYDGSLGLTGNAHRSSYPVDGPRFCEPGDGTALILWVYVL
jgi:hypothetical protein